MAKKKARRRSTPAPLELIIYIHGVSGDLRGRDHAPEYELLHAGVAARKPAWPSRFLGVEWGWNNDPGAPHSQQLLTDAQRQLGARVLPELFAARDFTVNPARAVLNRLRHLILYGFGDIFYYVSEAGKIAVRDAVAAQIIEFIGQETKGDAGTPISLTLIGHSAGSVIALDFLFALFNNAEGYNYLRGGPDEPQVLGGELEHLRDLAHGRQMLRVRRLITFGSPISLLACRSDAVLEILAAGDQLSPVEFGLTSACKGARALKGERWINLWDRDDPIAWPIEPLIGGHDGAVMAEDVHVDVSDLVSKAHTAYWRSARVHEAIADRW